MKAQIVIGLGFGDEGKGLTTDFLASLKPDSIVVRFSGGQQAGHNVVIGRKQHIHASYGAGSLRGLPSYLSEYCTFYPPNMLRESQALGFRPYLVIHPNAMLTTPYDVAFNRVREEIMNHGTCGIGVGATMKRNQGQYKLHAVDTQYPAILDQKLEAIKDYYVKTLIDTMLDRGYNNLFHYKTKFLKIVEEEFKDFHFALNSGLFIVQDYNALRSYDNIIFEGSQGVLLDMDHGIFPNVTFANTTSKNAMEICRKIGVDDVDIFYVTRCYSTRHGNGWIPDQRELNLVNNQWEINKTNEWQGEFKTGEIDYALISYAMKVNSSYSRDVNMKITYNLVVTCMDQRPDFKFDYNPVPAVMRRYESYGPEATDIRKVE